MTLGPNRLELRTTHWGRVNAGSIPGSDIVFAFYNFDCSLLTDPSQYSVLTTLFRQLQRADIHPRAPRRPSIALAAHSKLVT